MRFRGLHLRANDYITNIRFERKYTMTKFNKALINKDCGMYVTYGEDRKFIARFKHRGPFTKAKFIKELVANHTVEDYFAKIEAGEAPLAILRNANPDWFYGILEDFRFSKRL